MKCFVKLVFIVGLFACFCGSHATKLEEDIDDELENMKLISSSLRGVRRGFYSYGFRPYGQAAMTYDRNIKVCGGKGGGGGGRECCRKKCVDLKKDRYNCGRCGKRCRYSEICCKGKCVNPMFNRNNCGACNNKCRRGTLCVYGMCGYA